MSNFVQMSGKVVRAVEVRNTKTGKAVARFRISNKSQNAKHPVFVDVEAWEDVATKCKELFQTGTICEVQGVIRRDVWEKDGVERDKLYITAYDVRLYNESAADTSSTENEVAVAKQQTSNSTKINVDELPF